MKSVIWLTERSGLFWVQNGVGVEARKQERLGDTVVAGLRVDLERVEGAFDNGGMSSTYLWMSACYGGKSRRDNDRAFVLNESNVDLTHC